ncbi:MAG: hypothetical protein EI684_09775 [Candidatus Viridilinea halotolerans]|uniref:Tetratricopeptide repeat protein n=1 Tax=Candidatus Viridilinea halotolerans TaxID=2491704 RepID=A0A426U0U6_9CHLR|nr:MAG: hypothetical protein EI684_09775 [Candidatus Viridilinea halotolerans]
MAEPDSILQLGIEAAREGKKDEARQLFRLLTQQDPTNAQGWLWLAGVAENREERQHALERVVVLEPSNEMAVKGLQALGVDPSAVKAEQPVAAPVAVAPTPSSPPARQPEPDPFMDDDDPFAELNSLSETMAADTSGPVRRSDPEPEKRETGPTSAATAAARAEAGARRAEERMRENRRATGGSKKDQAPARRGFSPLLGLLLFFVGLGLVGLIIAWIWPLFFGRDQVAVNPANQTAVAQTAQAGTMPPVLEPPVEQPAEPPVEQPAEPPVEQPAESPVEQPAELPVEQPAALPASDVSGATPAVLAPNTPIQGAGWTYDFNSPTFAASIIGNLGQYTPNNGRFVVVLAFAFNGTGSEQAIPSNFFVLKDAQGRVWEARPEVSAAYVVPGINADLAHTQAMPSDGITRSVAIIFDVAPDATDLVFFSRSNPTQGWLVMRNL